VDVGAIISQFERGGTVQNVMVRHVQEALNAKFVKQGVALPIDGLAGPGTAGAYGLWQERRGVEVTYVPDRETLVSLGRGRFRVVG